MRGARSPCQSRCCGRTGRGSRPTCPPGRTHSQGQRRFFSRVANLTCEVVAQRTGRQMSGRLQRFSESFFPSTSPAIFPHAGPPLTNPTLSGWSFDLLVVYVIPATPFTPFTPFTSANTTLADRFRLAGRRGHYYSRLVTATGGARNDSREKQERNKIFHNINLLIGVSLQSSLSNAEKRLVNS